MYPHNNRVNNPFASLQAIAQQAEQLSKQYDNAYMQAQNMYQQPVQMPGNMPYPNQQVVQQPIAPAPEAAIPPHVQILGALGDIKAVLSELSQNILSATGKTTETQATEIVDTKAPKTK